MEKIDCHKEKVYRDIRNFVGLYADDKLYSIVFPKDRPEDTVDDKDLDYLAYKKSEEKDDKKDSLWGYRLISDHIEKLFRTKKITKDENKYLTNLIIKHYW